MWKFFYSLLIARRLTTFSLSCRKENLLESQTDCWTHALILISSDCSKLSLREYEGAEIEKFALLLDVVRGQIHDVEPRLVSVHRVEDYLCGRKISCQFLLIYSR